MILIYDLVYLQDVRDLSVSQGLVGLEKGHCAPEGAYPDTMEAGNRCSPDTQTTWRSG